MITGGLDMVDESVTVVIIALLRDTHRFKGLLYTLNVTITELLLGSSVLSLK